MVVADGTHVGNLYTYGIQRLGNSRGIRVYNLAYQDFVPDGANTCFNHYIVCLFFVAFDGFENLFHETGALIYEAAVNLYQ